MEGMYELLGQYFQLKLAYTVADQVLRLLFTVLGTVSTCPWGMRSMLNYAAPATPLLPAGIVASCTSWIVLR